MNVARRPATKNPWVRVIVISVISIVAFWFIYRGVLAFFSDNGKLPEFALLSSNLIISLWSAIVVLYVTTGHCLPGGQPFNSHQSPINTPPFYTAAAGVGPLVLIALLSASWVVVWLYFHLIHNAFLVALSDPASIGVHLTENEAMRIAAELGGLLFLGILFPLLTTCVLLAGWAARSRLRLVHMIPPATLFMLVSAFVNNWSQVMTTGMPPSYDAARMIFRIPSGPLTVPDLVLLWALSILVWAVTGFILASYGWLWAVIGQKMRQQLLLRANQHGNP
jgi:hypothetical protein